MSNGDFRAVKINLRGTVFVTNAEKFRCFPDSRLAKLTSAGIGFDSEKDEFFFDRNPTLFHSILDAYDNEEFHSPKNFCSTIIQRELRFWQLERYIVGKCCLSTLYKDDDNVKIYKEYEELFRSYTYSETDNSSNKLRSPNALFPMTSGKTARQRLWDILTHPTSSNIAKTYFATMTIAVLVSIIVFALSTMPAYRQSRQQIIEFAENVTNSKIITYMTTKQRKSLFLLDIITNTILATDFALTLYACPNRILVIKDWYAIGDILTILSVYAFDIIDQTDEMVSIGIESIKYIILWIGIAYCFRILRIFRLVGHTKGFIAIYMTIASKTSVILQFLLGFFFTCLISACAVYHAEIFAADAFVDIFASMWWSVVTLSTVGYGDVVPVTMVGKVISVFLISLGLVIIALPFVLITDDFGNYFSCYEYMEKHEQIDSKKEDELKKDDA